MCLDYLITIPYVGGAEVFNGCLGYWNSPVSDLLETHDNLGNPVAIENLFSLQVYEAPYLVDDIRPQSLQMHHFCIEPLSNSVLLMILRMGKPEEVLIIGNKNRNIVGETIDHNEALVLYKIMVEALVCLSHMDHDETENKMLKKLSSSAFF